MNPHIKELILLKKKHEGYLNISSPKERLAKIKKDYGVLYDFYAKANELADKIIKEAFNDNITLENISEIPEKFNERKKILDKVADYLNEKEALEVLEIEITKEDKFKRLCESALLDGVLSNEENRNLMFEATILQIEKSKAETILKSVLHKMEIAKPKELILEVLRSGHKMNIDEVIKEIRSERYGVNMSKQEVFTLLNEMNREVVYDSAKGTYYLYSSIQTKSSNAFMYRNTKYSYRLDDLPRNQPYVTFNSAPQKQECYIYINKNNKYFKNKSISSVLEDVIFDAIAHHQMQKINSEHLDDPIRQYQKFKEDIGYKLSNQTFSPPISR